MVIYINIHTKVKIQCLTCRSVNDITPLNHLQGSDCKNCSNIKNGNMKRKPVEQFIEESVAIHGDKYDYSEIEYITCKTKVKIWCLNCLKDFYQTPSDHLNGHGCKRCCFNCYSKKAIDWLGYI